MRGWTLQELIAPENVTFFDCDWHHLGTKTEHAIRIFEITDIDLDALCKPSMPLGRFCIAKRMSWASKRETTRIEDIAYSLLGIFNVNLPLRYGEGNYALTRLQQELARRYSEDSIFAWGLDTEDM